MSRALRHILVIATAMLLMAGGGVAQAADKAFSVRWAQTMRGDVLAVGNTSLSCPTAAANCANARNRVGAYNNNDFTMANVDIDGDGSTFNSSRATVALPAGATLAWAGLYWAADTSAGGSGAAAPTAANRGQVRVKVGSGAYQAVTSTETLTSTPQPSRYRALRRHHEPARRIRLAGRDGGQHPGGHRQRPLRRLVADRRLSRRHEADPSPQRLRRPRHGGRDPHVRDDHRAVPDAGHRHDHVARRPRLLRGRRQPPHGDRQVQRRRHDRRPQPGQQLPELDDRVRRRASHGQGAELPQPARRRHRLRLRHRRAVELAELGADAVHLDAGLLHAVGVLPDLRRGPGAQHGRARASRAPPATARRSPPGPARGRARLRSPTRTSGSAATRRAPTARTSRARPAPPTR